MLRNEKPPGDVHKMERRRHNGKNITRSSRQPPCPRSEHGGAVHTQAQHHHQRNTTEYILKEASLLTKEGEEDVHTQEQQHHERNTRNYYSQRKASLRTRRSCSRPPQHMNTRERGGIRKTSAPITFFATCKKSDTFIQFVCSSRESGDVLCVFADEPLLALNIEG